MYYLFAWQFVLKINFIEIILERILEEWEGSKNCPITPDIKIYP